MLPQKSVISFQARGQLLYPCQLLANQRKHSLLLQAEGSSSSSNLRGLDAGFILDGSALVEKASKCLEREYRRGHTQRKPFHASHTCLWVHGYTQFLYVIWRARSCKPGRILSDHKDMGRVSVAAPQAASCCSVGGGILWSQTFLASVWKVLERFGSRIRSREQSVFIVAGISLSFSCMT